MNKIKNSRAASFLLVALVYVVATVTGIVAYVSLPYNFALNLLIADVLATAVTFIFSLIFGNASVYDPYWSVQPPVILVAFAMGRPLTVAGALVLIAVLLWGVRLTANWAYTFGGLWHQDWRYTMLREQTGALYPLVNFIGIHLVPTLVVYLCTLPAVHIIISGASWNVFSVIFFLLSVSAAVLQGVADIQMHRYRRNRETPFVRIGLWKYSRHPNYLGEILMWWGVGLSAVCILPGSLYLLSGAVANTLLFTFISIPMAERRQSRKEGFDQYKAETRVLLPLKK